MLMAILLIKSDEKYKAKIYMKKVITIYEDLGDRESAREARERLQFFEQRDSKVESTFGGEMGMNYELASPAGGHGDSHAQYGGGPNRSGMGNSGGPQQPKARFMEPHNYE
jgi:hypothetical protein